MKLSVLAAASLILVSAGAASAQQVGNYAGTAADGSSVNFTVSTDTNTGMLQITSFGFGFNDTCSPGGFTFSSGWGLPGQSSDLTGNSTTYTFDYPYVDVTASIVFSGSSAHGKITNATPTLVAVMNGGMSKKAAFCSSPKQSYTVTLQTTDTFPAPKTLRPTPWPVSIHRN